jgi:hypothetical protein
MVSAQELQIVYGTRTATDAGRPGRRRTIEADSVRVPGTIDHRDELWDRCKRI